MAEIRTFDTGATRDTDEGKLDYEGFLNPLAVEAYAEYMHKNRKQKDGSLRDSDNWQKGIPKTQYMKSLLRHTHAAWKEHRGYQTPDGLKEALCGILFNTFGYLTELLKEEPAEAPVEVFAPEINEPSEPESPISKLSRFLRRS